MHSLSHSSLQDMVVCFSSIIDVLFVIPYSDILDEFWLIEVTGIEMVQGLHGWVHIVQLNEVSTPSFPFICEPFFNFYHLQDDVALWKSCNTYPAPHQLNVVHGISQPKGKFLQEKA